MCGNDLQHNSLSMRQLKMSEKENSVGWVKIRNWALGQWGTRPLNFYSVSILIFLFKKFGSEKLLTIIGGHIPPNKFAPMLWFGSYGSGSKGEKDGETGNIGKLKLLEIIKRLLGVGLSIWENGKFFENILILNCGISVSKPRVRGAWVINKINSLVMWVLEPSFLGYDLWLWEGLYKGLGV